MTLFNTQVGNGEFRLQFETDDKNKFLYMQEKARRCVDNKMTSDQSVHAHWMFINGHLAPMFKCSNCRNIAFNSPYCPSCGAKMDEETENKR